MTMKRKIEAGRVGLLVARSVWQVIKAVAERSEAIVQALAAIGGSELGLPRTGSGHISVNRPPPSPGDPGVPAARWPTDPPGTSTSPRSGATDTCCSAERPHTTPRLGACPAAFRTAAAPDDRKLVSPPTNRLIALGPHPPPHVTHTGRGLRGWIVTFNRSPARPSTASRPTSPSPHQNPHMRLSSVSTGSPSSDVNVQHLTMEDLL